MKKVINSNKISMWSDSTRPKATGSGDLWSLVEWRRPRSYWSTLVYHLPLSLIFGAALMLPLMVTLNRLPLIPCTFFYATGYPCPLCGFTRSFWAIASGQWWWALTNCPLAILVFVLFIGIFLWHFAAIVCGVILSPGPALLPGKSGRRKIIISVLVVFSINWLYRLFNSL